MKYCTRSKPPHKRKREKRSKSYGFAPGDRVVVLRDIVHLSNERYDLEIGGKCVLLADSSGKMVPTWKPCSLKSKTRVWQRVAHEGDLGTVVKMIQSPDTAACQPMNDYVQVRLDKSGGIVTFRPSTLEKVTG